MTIDSLLTQLGMTPEQTSLYLLTLKYRQATTSQLAKLANKARSTIYDQVQLMVSQGRLQLEKYGNRDMYTAIPPATLVHLLQSKIEQLSSLQTTLETHLPLFNEYLVHQKSIPTVKILEGLEAVTSIGTNGYDEGCFILNVQTILEHHGWSMETLLSKYLYNHRTKQQCILVDNPAGRSYAKAVLATRDPNNQAKLLPESYQNIQSDSALRDGIYTHLAYDPQILAIEIQNPSFFNSQQTIFSILRDLLPPFIDN